MNDDKYFCPYCFEPHKTDPCALRQIKRLTRTAEGLIKEIERLTRENANLRIKQDESRP